MGHDFFPGEQLGRYTLERVLGGGGFASVWRARAEGIGGFERAVAIKVIRPGRASQKRFREMLLDEARLVARIEHPNVAQVWEVGEDPRSLYIVMELVDGASLEDLRERAEERGEQLSARCVFRVLSDVCAGLHAAHELEIEPGSGEPLGLVHRDISPHNILVSRHGIAKLIDFGIAKARERIAGETTTGVIKGKLSFMAPEQARSEPSMDRRVDVWAIGAVAYELLEGRAPFEAATELGRLAALAGPAEVAPMSELTPPALRKVVARALSKDPDRRFPTALALKEAIDEALIDSELETSTHDVAEELAALFGRAQEPARATVEAASPQGATEVAPSAPPTAAEGTAERGLSSTILAAPTTDEYRLPLVRRSRWVWAAAALAIAVPALAWWSGREADRDARPVARAADAARSAPSTAGAPTALPPSEAPVLPAPSDEAMGPSDPAGATSAVPRSSATAASASAAVMSSSALAPDVQMNLPTRPPPAAPKPSASAPSPKPSAPPRSRPTSSSYDDDAIE